MLEITLHVVIRCLRGQLTNLEAIARGHGCRQCRCNRRATGILEASSSCFEVARTDPAFIWRVFGAMHSLGLHMFCVFCSSQCLNLSLQSFEFISSRNDIFPTTVRHGGRLQDAGGLGVGGSGHVRD